MNIEPTEKETTFIDAYLEAVNFTETGNGDEEPESGEEMDEDFIRESVIDCLAFYNRIACYLSDDRIEDAGHDFWFTRNGHGTGFWEEDNWPRYSGMFDRAAKSFGEAYVQWADWVSPSDQAFADDADREMLGDDFLALQDHDIGNK